MTLKNGMVAVGLFAAIFLTVVMMITWQVGTRPDMHKALSKAAPLTIEELGMPVKTSRLGKLYFAPNPDSKTWDLLQVYFPKYGGPNSIVIIDLGTDKVKILTTDRGLNFHLAPAVIPPNGKLYLSILDKKLHQKICIYDPGSNQLKLKGLKLPEYVYGESHPLVLGTDNKIYGAGSHPGKAATAFQIDPETNTVTGYGALGPSHAPNRCWGYSVAADHRYVYIASGKIPWYLVAYDRQAGRSTVLLETEKVGGNIKVRQGKYGCTATVYQNAGSKQLRTDYWLYKGAAITIKDGKEKPPWYEPAVPKMHLIQPPKPEVNRALAVPDREGHSQLWVRVQKKWISGPRKPSLDSIKDKTGWEIYNFKVPLYAQEIHRLVELPDGRIFGTAGSYEGNFIYDPATNRADHLGKIGLSHYATAIFDGKVYMSGYPTWPLYIYNLKKSWTAGKEIVPGMVLKDDHKDSNPRRLAYMGKQHIAGTHKMYAAAVGADKRIYFGGRWMRNGSAGGLAWYDTKTGEIGGFWKLFSNYQINYMTTANDGRFLVISTHRIEDSLQEKSKPEQGKLFIYDTSIRKIVREIEPVMEAKGAGLVVGTGSTRVLGWTEDPSDKEMSILYGVDIANGQVNFRKRIPFPLPVRIGGNQRGKFDYRLGPDGMVWSFVGGNLVRIDPSDASIHPVGQIPKGGRIAFSGSDIYLSGDTMLRRVKGVVDQ